MERLFTRRRDPPYSSLYYPVYARARGLYFAAAPESILTNRERDLTAPERVAVLELAHGRPAGGLSANALAVLSLAWEKHWWICCDCRAGVERQPMFTVRRSINNDYALVRVRTESTHDPRCPFADTPTARRVQQHPSGHALPKLFRMHLELLKTAGIHRVYPQWKQDPRYMSTQGRRISTAARTIHNGDVSLSQTLVTFAPRLGALAARLRRSEASPHRPSIGYVHTPIESYEAMSHHGVVLQPFAGEKIEVFGRTHRIGAAEGPYSAFLQISRRGGSNQRWDAAVASIVPIHSRTLWIPVFSRHERATLGRLLGLQQWWESHLHVGLVIEKSLPTQMANPLRSSFELFEDGVIDGPRIVVFSAHDSERPHEVTNNAHLVVHPDTANTSPDDRQTTEKRFGRQLTALVREVFAKPTVSSCTTHPATNPAELAAPGS